MFGSVTEPHEHPSQGRRQLGIDHKTHGLSDHEDGEIGLESRVFQNCGNIL